MHTIPVRHIAASVQEPDLSGEFSIRNVRDMVSGHDMVQPLHRHSFFFVLVLDKGVGTHTVDFVPYPVGNCSVFFLRPGQVHELTLRSESTGYLMLFNNDFYTPLNQALSQAFRKASNKTHYQLPPDAAQRLLSTAEHIFREYTNKQEHHKESIVLHLGVFFIELLRHSNTPSEVPGSNAAYIQERFEEFTELIEQHASAQKKVSFYAEALHLTSWQLNAIAKAAVGKTSSELINEYIVLEAKRYLLSTSNQVAAIAWHLGYEDASYFIRFFKKHTGYSPEAFRSRFR